MRPYCHVLTGLACLLFAATVATAQEPIHVQIDRLVSARFADRAPTGIVEDANFVRRVWLDLAGRIPSAEQARTFLRDNSEDKRGREIDRLLAAPSYAEHMTDRFHVMLMERRGDEPHWQTFLRNCFERNQPWNQVVREILKPEDQDETRRGAAYFYTKRLEKYGQNPIDYSGLTRDVGRLFLGVDLQCAECHDHLFIDAYKQQEFQGLFVVYKGLSLRRGVKFPAIDEKAMTSRLEFVSVFESTKRQTGPRIPFGEEFCLPEAVADPASKAPEPTFSALELIARELPSANRELFTKNIANRLWFQMMGRGLVEPLDQFHSGNPPSHPQLLDLLAREFAAHEFDIKWFLRELALTDTYQRSTRFQAGTAATDATDPPMSAQTGSAQTGSAQTGSAQTGSAKDVPAQKESAQKETGQQRSIQKASARQPDDEDGSLYRVANEKRLSAEQLFRSTLLATGGPSRESKNEEGVTEGDDLRARFLKAFANEAREPEIQQNATVKAALFLLNDDKLLALLEPQDGNLVGRLAKIAEERELCDELFLSVFTRLPNDEERATVTGYLQTNTERRDVALGHLVWSLLTSMEFCVNH